MMFEFGHPLFAAEVVDCIAQGREPTPQELATVAERIRREAESRPLFDWDRPDREPEVREVYIRAANAALRGNAERAVTRRR